ncbi:alpha-tectorin-like [Scomber japonicus]|uniref:alpha-tectorin-like n=1 Tax=Scomber japonicus TaxID=13676 RepID=UPI0023054600|nr:alpha-tectorin-like [Scomber japonicus]
MLRLLLCVTAVVHFTTGADLPACQGENKCFLCTVTGPTVIDINGQVNSAKDRCGYTLMKTTSIPGIKVHVTFKERRRVDVSFLDSVILQLEDAGVKIYLKQGGKVMVGDAEKKLSTTAETVNGVALSKDTTGVMSKMSKGNYMMTVFFDGSTAQIHIKAPKASPPTVEGLCGNSMKFSDEKATDHSPKECDKEHKDDSKTGIECAKMTKRCEILKEAPFDKCKSYVDPQPYITACTNTLCKYPGVDGFKCQFLEAYARVCSLYNDDVLKGWRANVECSTNFQTLCLDRFCTADEFCGDSLTGGTRCRCRAIFASTYDKTLGETKCDGSAVSVSLVGCLLEDKGIKYSDLHLFDETCKGEMDAKTHMVSMDFDTKSKPCGAMVRLDDEGNMINKNGVLVKTTREEVMDLTCPFVIPNIDIDFSLDIVVTSGDSGSGGAVEYTIESGPWKYTLNMKAFSDAARTKPVTSDSTLKLNQKIWFAMEAVGLDSGLVSMVTDSCYATNVASSDDKLKYELIKDGCPHPLDKTVHVEDNGKGTTNYFSFNMFRFSGKSRDVYLHCKISLCVKSSNTCAKVVSMETRTARQAVDLCSDS